MPRRRLALITPGFSATERDWCIPALLDLVRALQRDEDVTVFSLRYPHTRLPYRVHGALVVPFGAAQARGPGRLSLWLRAARRVRADVRAGRFDLVHALWAHEPGALGAWACRDTRVPLVVSLLGGELEALAEIAYGGQLQPLNRRLVAYALGRAARVTCGSELLLAAGARRVESQRLRRLPLGFATERFHPGVAKGGLRLEGRPCLLSVASLVPVKDHATLLSAFRLALAEWPASAGGDPRLHLVGDGPLRAQLEQLVLARGLERHVRFHGALPHDALPALYRQADVHVTSSRFESQCLAALEAAACGAALAGTRVGALPEVVPPEALSEPGDAAGLAAGLVRAAAAPPAHRTRLAMRVAGQFGLDSVLPRLRGLYDELCPAAARA